MTPAAIREMTANAQRAKVLGCDLRFLRVGTGRPVVLVHTLRTQLEYFLPLIGQLDTTRVEVIAIDLPGHGESSAPPVDYTANYFTDATEALIEHLELRDVVFVGESIGASIALILAARGNSHLAYVIASNPYDYGRWGGIRRSSPLNNVVFTAMLWPVIGPLVPYAATKGMLRLVMTGGLHDRHKLPRHLVADMHRCGLLPGHAQAFRSLSRNWRSWISARAQYGAITTWVTLIYGDEDWSRPAEPEANAHTIPGARTATLQNAGHFACLEEPRAIADLITAVV